MTSQAEYLHALQPFPSKKQCLQRWNVVLSSHSCWEQCLYDITTRLPLSCPLTLSRLAFWASHRFKCIHTKKVWLPVLLHHNEGVSRLYKQFDTAQKNTISVWKKANRFKKSGLNGGGVDPRTPPPCVRHWSLTTLNERECRFASNRVKAIDVDFNLR